MLTHPCAAHLPLASLLLAAGCYDDHQHTAAPPTTGSLDPGSSESSSAGAASTSGSSSAPQDETGTPDPSTSGEPPTTGDSGSSSMGETMTEDPCAAPSTCEPSVDPTWSGPVVLREAAACGAGVWGTLEDVVHADLEGPPANCTCECDDQGVGTCPTSVELHQHESDDCSGTSEDWTLTSLCNSAVAGAAGTSFEALSVPVQGVTCDADFTESIPAAAFSRNLVLCGPTEIIEPCAGEGLCVPALDDESDALCIWQEGDLECPEAWGGDRKLYHREFTDDRACSECSCGEFDGVCTGYTVHLFGTNTCSEAPVGAVTPGNCAELGNQGVTAGRRSGVGVPQPGCVGKAQGGDPMGGVEATSPVTVCCQQDG